MDSKLLLEKALRKEFLSAEEGQFLYENVPTADLMWVANELRQMQVP
ncbi:MAG: dehypoxanthine futalosine cyclase, partial [Flavobacteriales bacterium]|nr:dehypoxanthine futalosine cyclase [Flavobacteriales bacterium]